MANFLFPWSVLRSKSFFVSFHVLKAVWLSSKIKGCLIHLLYSTTNTSMCLGKVKGDGGGWNLRVGTIPKMTQATILPPSLFAYLCSLFLGATWLNSSSQEDKKGRERWRGLKGTVGVGSKGKHAIRNKNRHVWTAACQAQVLRRTVLQAWRTHNDS